MEEGSNSFTFVEDKCYELYRQSKKENRKFKDTNSRLERKTQKLSLKCKTLEDEIRELKKTNRKLTKANNKWTQEKETLETALKISKENSKEVRKMYAFMKTNYQRFCKKFNKRKDDLLEVYEDFTISNETVNKRIAEYEKRA